MKQKIIQTYDNTLLSYPKGFIEDIQSLKTNFGSMENIVRDMLIFLSNKNNQDLFGYISFSAKEFAEFMGYSVNTLQKTTFKDSESFRKVIKPNYKEHNWSNYIESSLLFMLKVNFVFSTEYKGKIRMTSMQLLSDLETEKSPQANKPRIYKIKLGTFVQSSFFKEYVSVVYDDYLKLQITQTRKSGECNLTNLYLYLLKIYRDCEYKQNFVYVNYLDDISNFLNQPITDKNHRDRKRRIKKYLDTLQSTLKSLPFQYSFETVNKWKYKVKFTFEAAINLDINKDYHTFKVTVFNKYENSFLASTPNTTVDFSKLFMDWFSNKSIDEDLKKSLQCQAIKVHYPSLKNVEYGQLLLIINEYYPNPTFKELYIHLAGVVERHKKNLLENEKLKSKNNQHWLMLCSYIKSNDSENLEQFYSIAPEVFNNEKGTKLAYEYGSFNALLSLISFCNSPIDNKLFKEIKSSNRKEDKELYCQIIKAKNHIKDKI